MLGKFLLSQKGNLIEVVISLVVLGALSYGFWNVWNITMDSAGKEMKAKIESDTWLD